MNNNLNKLKEKIAIFVVWLDEKFEIMKSNKKVLMLIASFIVVIFMAVVISPTDKNDPEEYKPVVQETQDTNVAKGYEVKNNEMYQRGIDYYKNTMRKTNELWEMQCSVPFYFDGTIEETSQEKNITLSDSLDYFYGAIIAIRDETKENLNNLQENQENSQVIEYEKKILSFIDEAVENYSVDYKISEADIDEYIMWITKKSELLGDIKTETDTNTEIETEADTYTSGNVYLDIEYGEFVEAIENGDILVVKAKISPSYSNKATINQNSFNVEDIVKNQVGNKYKEIQYWAVADMADGSESKVVSFTIGEKVIEAILNGTIPGNMVMDYASDVWILPSLLD